MYNEERKMKFLHETHGSVNFGRSVFRTTAPYEQRDGMDFCELHSETLHEILNQNFGIRTRSMESIVALMRSYVQWCKDCGYQANDNIYFVETQMDEKIKRLMVASPKHLQLILDKIFEPVEHKTVDCIYRCYIWMAFAGLENVDTVQVKVSDVNLDSMMIEYNGRSYEICREAVPAFRLACNATEFVYKHPRYEDKIRARFPGEYLMRGIRSERIRLGSIKGWVGKLFREHGVMTSYSNIRLSGMFYRAYEMERIGMEVNFDGEIANRIDKMDHTYHKNYTRNKLAGSIRQDMLDDYACWKAAFT